jgi:hypothetical protein
MSIHKILIVVVLIVAAVTSIHAIPQVSETFARSGPFECWPPPVCASVIRFLLTHTTFLSDNNSHHRVTERQSALGYMYTIHTVNTNRSTYVCIPEVYTTIHTPTSTLQLHMHAYTSYVPYILPLPQSI